MLKRITVILIAVLAGACAAVAQTPKTDPFIWLEAPRSPKAMNWVKQQNAKTLPVLEKVPEYAPIQEKLLNIFASRKRIPYPQIRGGYIYNFWRDTTHVHGIWRRTTPASYLKAAPEWETVIDVDALVKKEHTDWVWKGATWLEPGYRLCMVALSHGGKDAVVWREFDTRTRTFVKGGFVLPEAKSDVSWKDANTLWVGTDFGKGSLTTSGYPRIVKEWKRGTPLSAARTVLEGSVKDVSDSVYSQHTPEGRYDIAIKGRTFFTSEHCLILGGRLVKLGIPIDAKLYGFFKNQMLFSLRSKWTEGGKTYPQGALLSIDLDRFLQGDRSFKTLFTPTERTSLDTVAWTRNYLLMNVLDNVHSRLYSLSFDGGKWPRREITLPGLGTAGITTTSDSDDTFFVGYTDFLTPTTLYLSENGGALKKVKTSPTFFDASGMKVAQHEAVSKDGTKIPYFVVMPKGFKADGKNPTILYGYGGFEVSLLPHYSSVTGTAWLSRGGVYVLANIRGGGEFGPRWHEAALKKNRHKAFEDFIAVAEDLVARKITSPRHLGIMGGSNGGLLVGAVTMMRPGLFRAVACQIPLLDMRRYTKIGAGSSWIAEYGDPDKPAAWAWIRKWSPYQNVKKGVHYPRIFFYTSTADDRVGPAHARKMAARMEVMGHPVYFYENTEGGHSAGANLKQTAHMYALTFAYFWKMLR